MKGKTRARGNVTSTSRAGATTTWAEVTKAMLNHFVKNDNEREDTANQAAIGAAGKREPNIPAAAKVSTEEIRGYTANLKNKVAPGLDLVENEMIKAVGDLVAPTLAELFNKCREQGVLSAYSHSTLHHSFLRSYQILHFLPSAFADVLLSLVSDSLLSRVLICQLLKGKLFVSNSA